MLKPSLFSSISSLSIDLNLQLQIFYHVGAAKTSFEHWSE